MVALQMKEQEIQHFEEYFQLKHSVDAFINVDSPIDELPSDEEFESMIPEPFKIAADFNGLDQIMSKPMRQLGDMAEPLADFLKAQSRKIDLMLNYILQQHDDNSTQIRTVSYGGSGIIIPNTLKLNDNTYYPCKLYFSDDATAIYCLVKVISAEQNDDEQRLLFSQIREQDREVVVRATLHQQSKMLSKRKNES